MDDDAVRELRLLAEVLRDVSILSAIKGQDRGSSTPVNTHPPELLALAIGLPGVVRLRIGASHQGILHGGGHTALQQDIVGRLLGLRRIRRGASKGRRSVLPNRELPANRELSANRELLRRHLEGSSGYDNYDKYNQNFQGWRAATL